MGAVRATGRPPPTPVSFPPFPLLCKGFSNIWRHAGAKPRWGNPKVNVQ